MIKFYMQEEGVEETPKEDMSEAPVEVGDDED